MRVEWPATSQEGLTGGQESRGAEAALEGSMAREGLLKRRGAAGTAHPLHRGHRVTIGLGREDEAGPRRPAIDEDRAGAADPVLAAEMGARQPE